MTVSAGNTALASDYEALADKIDEWFTDACPACTFGDPNQQFGWGGVTTPLVSPGNDMLASQMNALINRINIGINMTSVTGPLTPVVATEKVLASQYNTAEAKEVLIRAQKNLIQAAQLTLLGTTNSIRTTPYSNSINAVFRYTFSDFNDARYFFNSGGALTLHGVQSGGTGGTGYDTLGIRAILTTMGLISMDYNITTQSGSGGSTSSIGFYDLTTSYQQIFTQSGVGAYSNANVTLQALRNIAGNQIDINFIINPEVGRTVDGTTTAYGKYKKLNDQSSGGLLLQIDPPSTITVPDPF
jgi:hypothetical protein